MSGIMSEKIELWSRTLDLGTVIDRSTFTTRVREAAVARRERYTGFIQLGYNRASQTTVVSSFTRTRYPRNKYGTPTVPECETGMKVLESVFDGDLTEDTQEADFRVVFGLIEGYGGNRIHTVDEVAACLKEEKVEPAEVFAIRLQGNDVGIYTEPAAIIRGSISRLAAVHELAEYLMQERYTVEDFSNRQTYTVETKHCTEPDAQF